MKAKKTNAFIKKNLFTICGIPMALLVITIIHVQGRFGARVEDNQAWIISAIGAAIVGVILDIILPAIDALGKNTRRSDSTR
jgi:hypothetical protein